MNARKIWTELFQKPAGGLALFLLVGAIFLAFVLMRRAPRPKPDNTPVARQATQAKCLGLFERPFSSDLTRAFRFASYPDPQAERFVGFSLAHPSI